jgi:hypothetical protein
MLDQRFWSKTIRNERGCLIWTASKNAAGYGYFGVGGKKNRYAHRVAWEDVHGAIPEGLEIDHVVCDKPSCVNVAHLALSTSRANTLRSTGPSAANARKTHCLRGHPLSGENLHIDPSGRRICRACKRAENRSDRARARKAAWWRKRYGKTSA